MSKSVLVLGANGRFGRLAVRAFADAGWRVFAQARHALRDSPIDGVTRLDAAVQQTGSIVAAASGAGVVVNAMNPLYTNWDREALPLNAAAIDAARGLDATLMLPGNVYNYGSPMPAELTEATPHRPTTRKGEIRCAMEAAMRERAPRSIVVRAGDFFGGPGTGSWIDQAIAKDLARGRITYPGPLRLEHAWAYLPDLARAFVLLADAGQRRPAHDEFLFPGHTLTGEELVAGLTRAAQARGLLAAGTTPRVSGMPWPLLRVAGLANPMLRELSRMSYLWREAHRLSGRKLEGVVGTVPHTPLDEALESTLAQLYPAAARGS